MWTVDCAEVAGGAFGAVPDWNVRGDSSFFVFGGAHGNDSSGGEKGDWEIVAFEC